MYSLSSLSWKVEIYLLSHHGFTTLPWTELTVRTWTISIWRRPRNPHLKPNPMALEDSGSNCINNKDLEKMGIVQNTSEKMGIVQNTSVYWKRVFPPPNFATNHCYPCLLMAALSSMHFCKVRWNPNALLSNYNGNWSDIHNWRYWLYWSALCNSTPCKLKILGYTSC